MSVKATIMVAVLSLVLLTGACSPAAAPSPAPAASPAGAGKAVGTPTTAASSSPAVVTTAQPANFKFGSISAISDAGVYVALDKGYFREQGINMELQNFSSASEALPPLATGQVDAIGSPITSALLAAADRGVDLKLVADKGQSRPKWEISWIVLRKDLADSVKKASDLKGMKVVFPSQGSHGDQMIHKFLQEGGVKPGDVDVEILPMADQAAAFGNKAIAAGQALEPYIARGVQEGFSVKWIPDSGLYAGSAQQAGIIFGPTVLKDQDLGRRWMVAYLKGVRDYLKAFTTKEGRQEIVDILVKYSTVKDPKLYDLMEMPYLDPNGIPDQKSMDMEFKQFKDDGVYKGSRTLSDIMDLSFANYAAQELGKQ